MVMSSTTGAISARPTASESTRWGQLIFGIICMVMIANLQYGWTLFVNPIDQKYHWGRAGIQVAFTIFVLMETWLVPFEGYHLWAEVRDHELRHALHRKRNRVVAGALRQCVDGRDRQLDGGLR